MAADLPSYMARALSQDLSILLFSPWAHLTLPNIRTRREAKYRSGSWHFWPKLVVLGHERQDY